MQEVGVRVEAFLRSNISREKSVSMFITNSEETLDWQLSKEVWHEENQREK